MLMIFFEKSLNILTKTILENSGFHLDAWWKGCCDHAQTSGVTSVVMGGGWLKGGRQKPPNIHQHIINFIFSRQVDGSDQLHKTSLQIIMFIVLDIEYQQCTTPRTRLSRTPSGRPAAHPQLPRAISLVREKRYDRMGFGFMHMALKYQNEAVISCLTASGEIRDNCHSNRAEQGSYMSTKSPRSSRTFEEYATFDVLSTIQAHSAKHNIGRTFSQKQWENMRWSVYRGSTVGYAYMQWTIY